ncbi:ATP-binding cassette domain-containing protein [Loktanella sp. IMCC34160]|uniref:ATP-binding cassette domain-containing protein n=1 Tax=Loktanella sp. IMCC34160 TaxID=2510646 RepID=UPI00101D1412|nr:ATP-binding cassette domain-containing protein [Loktanella sp. IMCC34160]RYG91790.1 ATP-binding cassette domain-containing protein [Loktanella sp. IMCC34160]
MSGPVIAFDINATRGGKLTRLSSAETPDQPQASKVIRVGPAQPAAASATQPPSRIQARADLVVVYAGLLGVDVTRADVLDGMTTAGDATPEVPAAKAIPAALDRTGLVTRSEPAPTIPADRLPVLAVMSSGQVVLVLEHFADTVVLHDTTQPGNRAEVPWDEFNAHFAGRLIRADLPVEELTRRHARDEALPHWFWGEVTKFRRHIIEVALGSFVANLLAVAVALFSLQVYDRVIPHQSVATLWVLAIGAGLAMLLEAFLRIARARLMDGAGRRIEMKVQAVLMDRILGMQGGAKRQAPSQLFSAVRDFGSIREFFTASTIGTLTDLPFIVLFLALVASIGGNVVWVLFIGGLLMVLPSFFLQRKMITLTTQTQGANAKSARLLHEVIYEADTIKAQRGEERFRRLWGEMTALSSLATSEQRKLASTLTFWAQGVQQATYVAAVVAGTFMVFMGEFTVGTIIAVGILTSRTLGPLTQLAATLARWSNVKAALTALDEVANAPQDVDAARTYLRRDKIDGGFEVRDLTFAYDEDTGRALDIPGLSIAAGSHVAVLGANGSGKSTFLKILAGLYPPASGRVMIDGVDMGQVMPRDLRRHIGYLGQEVRLFAGTLRDNLNLTMLERDDDRLLQALDFAGLGPFVRGHPKGLDLPISDGGAGLSIGQRQSIGWARLWLQDPKVCLLDEPTAALDSTLETTLVSRLETWLTGRTAIIATHRVPILQLTDRTVILQNGRLAVDGPRDEVLNHLRSNRTAG